MNSHPDEYEEAVGLAVKDKQPFSWRAAWLLWSCMEENDPRIKGHLKTIIDCIEGKSDGHKRELIKILLMMELSEEQEGLVFDICMNAWEKVNSAPSVRHTAFKMILRIAKKYPELQNDIVFITQDHYLDSLSPGIRSSVIRMLNEE